MRSPYGIRTRAIALKEQRPWPLDEGALCQDFQRELHCLPLGEYPVKGYGSLIGLIEVPGFLSGLTGFEPANPTLNMTVGLPVSAAMFRF